MPQIEAPRHHTLVMTALSHPIRIKRVHLPAEADDGARVLVDRLWPRGISRESAALTLWLKDIAPSTALRTWFGHDPVRWPDFCQRYRAELADREAELQVLRELATRKTLTLLFAAQDEARNNAVVLAELLQGGGSPPPDSGTTGKPG